MDRDRLLPVARHDDRLAGDAVGREDGDLGLVDYGTGHERAVRPGVGDGERPTRGFVDAESFSAGTLGDVANRSGQVEETEPVGVAHHRYDETIAVEVDGDADRAGAYGLESIIVDGNDADAVYEVAVQAIARARAGEGPSLIEAETYRHGGHSRADPGKYRPDDEVAQWLAKDPIPRYRERLVEFGVDEATLRTIESDVADEVEAATEGAKAGAIPGEDLLMKDVWANGGSSWRN